MLTSRKNLSENDQRLSGPRERNRAYCLFHCHRCCALLWDEGHAVRVLWTLFGAEHPPLSVGGMYGHRSVQKRTSYEVEDDVNTRKEPRCGRCSAPTHASSPRIPGQPSTLAPEQGKHDCRLGKSSAAQHFRPCSPQHDGTFDGARPVSRIEVMHIRFYCRRRYHFRASCHGSGL